MPKSRARSRICGPFILRMNGDAMRSIDEAKFKVSSAMEGGFKRLGALCLKAMAVPMVPLGLGFMLYGLFEIATGSAPYADGEIMPFVVGVSLVILAACCGFCRKSSKKPPIGCAIAGNKTVSCACPNNGVVA